jgi:hypothetical protein
MYSSSFKECIIKGARVIAGQGQDSHANGLPGANCLTFFLNNLFGTTVPVHLYLYLE